MKLLFPLHIVHQRNLARGRKIYEDRLVLILCDLEAAPSVVKDKVTAEVVDLYAALSTEQQAEARRYLKYLNDKH